MTLVQNHLQQSNGNKIIKSTAMLFAVLLLHSCTLFKPVNTTTGQKPDDFPTDITGPVTVDPNTGEPIYNQKLDIALDTIQWTETEKNSPVITSNTTEVFNPGEKDPNTFNSGMKISYLLPFNAVELNAFSEKLPSKSLDALHYHNGVLMAMDNLKEKNILFTATFIDTEGNSKKLENRLSSSRAVRESNLIIGPFKSSCAKVAAEYAKENKIPMVSPRTMRTNITESNPYYLQMNPSVKAHCEALMAYALKHYKPEQIVLAGRSKEASEMEMMAYCVDYFNKQKPEGDSTYIKEFVITDDSPGYTNVDVSGMIHNSLPSAIIIPSFKEESFVYEMLNKIRIKKEEREIAVFGLPQWKTKFVNISPSMFESLNVHITASSYIDIFDPEIKEWRKKYYERFAMIPEDEAYMAYVTTNYFVKLFAVNGPAFHFLLDSQQDENLVTKFRFEKVMTPILQFQDDFSYMPVERFENKHLNILKFKDRYFQPVEKIALLENNLDIEDID